MFDISKPLEDKLILDNKEYQLFLSFDTVIWILEILKKDDLPEITKLKLALAKATKYKSFKDISSDKAIEYFEALFNEHIKIVNENNEVPEFDIAGNPLPKIQNANSQEKPLFSLSYDGEYIYSSFMQAYHIDLIEEQGKLHWKKFNALLSGLPENTKLVEVMRIRAWEPQKGESEEERRQKRKLKKQYALPKEF